MSKIEANWDKEFFYARSRVVGDAEYSRMIGMSDKDRISEVIGIIWVVILSVNLLILLYL
jgi:hypothetical protein